MGLHVKGFLISLVLLTSCKSTPTKISQVKNVEPRTLELYRNLPGFVEHQPKFRFKIIRTPDRRNVGTDININLRGDVSSIPRLQDGSLPNFPLKNLLTNFKGFVEQGKLIGERIENEITEEVGRGGMGVVYQVGKSAVLKTQEIDPEGKIYKEILAHIYINMNKPSLSPIIFNVLTDSAKDEVYYVMEKLHPPAFISKTQIQKLFEDMQWLAKVPLHHYDLKPLNILENLNGQLKIIDWGWVSPDPKKKAVAIAYGLNGFNGAKSDIVSLARSLLELRTYRYYADLYRDVENALRRGNLIDRVADLNWREAKFRQYLVIKKFAAQNKITYNNILRDGALLKKLSEFERNYESLNDDIGDIAHNLPFDAIDLWLVKISRGDFATVPSALTELLKTAGEINDRLLSPDRLQEGQELISQNKQYRLQITEENTLKLIGPKKEKILFQDQSSKEGPFWLTVQVDGNVVLYDKNSKPRWTSNSAKNSKNQKYNLILQNDGNLVVYGNQGVVWSLGTDWQ